MRIKIRLCTRSGINEALCNEFEDVMELNDVVEDYFEEPHKLEKELSKLTRSKVNLNRVTDSYIRFKIEDVFKNVHYLTCEKVDA